MNTRKQSSLGFFSQKTVIKALQVANSIAAAVVLYDFFTNPKATWYDQGLDVAAHVLQAFVTEHSSRRLIDAADIANMIRSLTVGESLLLGFERFSYKDIPDLAFHLGNLFTNGNLLDEHPTDLPYATNSYRA